MEQQSPNEPWVTIEQQRPNEPKTLNKLWVQNGQPALGKLNVFWKKLKKPFAAKTIKWPALPKKLLLLIFVLIIANILFAVIGSAITSPVNTAKGYFRAKANGNWSRVYNYFSLGAKESDFINKDSFIRLNKGLDISEYEITGRSPTTYSAKYIVKGSTSPQNENISLNVSGKSLIFFDAYHVNPANFIVSNYQITAPAGAAVYVDNIQLKRQTSSADTGFLSKQNDTFIIPMIFAGMHDVKIVHPACKELDDKIQIGGSGATSYNVPSLKLSASVKTDLAGKTEDLYRKIIASALNNDTFLTLKLPVTSSDNPGNDIVNSYNLLVSAIYREDGWNGYKSIDITSFTDNSTQTDIDSSGTYTSVMSVAYDYTIILYDGQGGETEQTASSNAFISFVYVYENGSWVIQSMHLGTESLGVW